MATNEKLASSMASMITEYVEGGITGGTDWRNGLEAMILRRIQRLAAQPAQAWQPIETAPKNTALLVAHKNENGKWRIVKACYHTQLEWSDEYGDHEQEFAPEDWYEESESSDVIYPTSGAPTHWQPLPTPPDSTPDENGGEHA